MSLGTARAQHDLAVLDANSAQRRMELVSKLTSGLAERDDVVATRARSLRDLDYMVDEQSSGWDASRRVALQSATASQREELARRLAEAEAEATLFRDALFQEQRLATLDEESSRMRAAVASRLLDEDERRRAAALDSQHRTHADHSAAIVDLKRTEYGRALDTLSAQAETIADLRSTASFEQVASTSDQARIRELEAALERAAEAQRVLGAHLAASDAKTVAATAELIQTQAEVRATKEEVRHHALSAEHASARVERGDAHAAMLLAKGEDHSAARQEWDAQRASHGDAITELEAKNFRSESALAHTARQLKTAQRTLQKERRAHAQALLEESTRADELKASLSSVVKQSHTIMTGQAAAQKRELVEQATALRTNEAQLARAMSALRGSRATVGEQKAELEALRKQLADAMSVGSGQLHDLRRKVKEKHEAHAGVLAQHGVLSEELATHKEKARRHHAELKQTSTELFAKHAEHEKTLTAFRRQRMQLDRLQAELAKAHMAASTARAAHAKLEHRQGSSADPRVMRWEMPSLAAKLPLGTRVKRGRDWRWGDQDGGAGNMGTVVVDVGLVGVGWASVRWDDAEGQSTYRVGHKGACDLAVLVARPPSPTTVAAIPTAQAPLQPRVPPRPQQSAAPPAAAPAPQQQQQRAAVHVDRYGTVQINGEAPPPNTHIHIDRYGTVQLNDSLQRALDEVI